jgi:hypothetical protein
MPDQAVNQGDSRLLTDKQERRTVARHAPDMAEHNIHDTA